MSEFENNKYIETSRSFFDQKKVGADNIYLIAWVDSIERLDSIILEIRHLQLNIIHLLREPELYLPLRFEENYLWGKEWEDIIKDNDQADDKNYTNKWVIAYPPFPPKSEINFDEDSNEDENDIDETSNGNEIRKRLEKMIRFTGQCSIWNKDQKSAYYSLRGLQYLKREILRDKIRLCSHVYKKSHLHVFSERDAMSIDANNKAQFMILRAAIMHRASKYYIERLADFYQEYEAMIDNDSDGLPRSSIHRRREIYLYSNFLDERALGTLSEMEALCKAIFKGVSAEKDIIKCLPKRRDILFIHNWKNSHVSSSKDFKINNSEDGTKKIIHLSTNFWMPERPDLQPVIAHEIAHSVIRSIYDDLRIYVMQAMEDDFSYLLLRIENVLDEYKVRFSGTLNIDPTNIVREIACDFLASSLNGFSYLFSFFLEFISKHPSFAGMFIDGGEDQYNFDTLELSKIGKLGRSLYDSREWYLRGKVLVTWLKSIHHRELSFIDEQLLFGIDTVLDDLLNYYITIAANEEDAKEERLWRTMTDHVCELIDINKVTFTVRKWREARSNSEYSVKTGEKKVTGESDFPRHTKRLDVRVRDHLFLMQMVMKIEKNRPLHTIPREQLDDAFNYFYITDKENRNIYHQTIICRNNSNVDKQPDGSGPLYRHIYDIPWQSALMRAKDLLWSVEFKDNKFKVERRRNKFQTVLNNIQHHFPFGRDLFNYALEFHLFDSVSPLERIATVRGLIDSWEKEIDENARICQEEVESKIVKVISSFNKKVKSSLTFRGEEVIAGRSLSKLYHDLVALRMRLYDDINSALPALNSLISFLEAHSKYDNKESGNNLFNNMLQAFSFSELNNNKTKMVSEIIPFSDNVLNTNETKPIYYSHMIGRTAIAGSYKSVHGEGLDKERIIPRSKFLSEIGKNKERSLNGAFSWYSLSNSGDDNKEDGSKEKGDDKKTDVTRYYLNLGRYDAFSITVTPLPCHCPLPRFSNKTKEIFPTFITRKELAIPVRLDLKEEWPFLIDLNNKKGSQEGDKIKPLSVVFVTLKRPSYRLSFLHRIIESISAKKDPNNVTDKPITMNNIGQLFHEYDCAFLTDGQADVMFIFHNAEINVENGCKLDRIFEIQNLLYEDFMVDRTRTIFTIPALSEIDASKYRVFVKARLIEDRTFNHANDAKRFNIPDDGSVLYKVPGQYDFEFVPSGKFVRDGIRDRKLYENIAKVFEKNNYLDRIETNIFKKWK